MMYAPQPVIDFLNANNVEWRADLYKVTLADGTIVRWTNADASLTVGGQTYLAAGAVQRRSNVRRTSKLEVDALTLTLASTVLMNGRTIASGATLGVFDGARVQIDRLVGTSPSHAIGLGVIPAWFEGRVGQVEPGSLETLLTVNSDLEALNVLLPRAIYGAPCANTVYDAGCTLTKADWTLSGTVASATTTTIATATAGLTAKAAGYFDLGVVVFTSGALAGTRASVKAGGWSGSVATLACALRSVPQAGDAFTIYPGCDRTRAGGCTKFSNTANFRGFPHIPTPEGAK